MIWRSLRFLNFATVFWKVKDATDSKDVKFLTVFTDTKLAKICFHIKSLIDTKDGGGV